MQVKQVTCSCGLSGELVWDVKGNLTLELGDYFYGAATASSVKEKCKRHVRIQLHDIPRMIATLLDADGPLRCQWLMDAQWGDFLYVQCMHMPQRVEIFTGGHSNQVDDWIKIHFQNQPTPSRSKLCLALMMGHHPRLGVVSALQLLPSELLMHALEVSFD